MRVQSEIRSDQMLDAGDLMLEAIALSSPSGHMSKRARERAIARIDAALAEAAKHDPPPAPPIDEVARLRRQAAELRELAARGMCPRAYPKRAAALEAQAAMMEATK
jgi:hypothetical protein